MSGYRYARDALTGDYVRAGAGLALTAGPLLVVDVGLLPRLILGGLALLFAYFGWRTWVRQMTIVSVGEDGISTSGPLRASLSWPELKHVKLSYFSTRRDKSSGWMQLKLRGGGRNLQLDSNIEGFDEIARYAYDAAVANGLSLSPTTVSNFAGLGLSPAGEDTGWGDPKEWQDETNPSETRHD